MRTIQKVYDASTLIHPSVGAIITATATNRSAFIGGRFMTGMGTAAAQAGAKAYLAEITPPKSRGFFLGFLNSL